MVLRLGIDLDNVIAETSQYVAGLVANYYIPLFTVDDWTSWHLTDCADITLPQQEHVFAQLHQNLDKLVPVPGARETLDKLSKAGHNLHILTHRPYDSGIATAEWLHDHYIVHNKLTICEDKTTLLSDIDVLIEDSPDVATKAALQGTLVYLFDRPWNQNLPYHYNILRVKNWTDILERLDFDFPTKVSKVPLPIPEEDILAEAYRLTSGDRQMAYGHPYDDFSRTGRLWAALLDLKDPIPAHKVAEMMMLVKMSRIETSPDSRDHAVDLAGYSRCLWLCRQREQEKMKLGEMTGD